MKMPESIPASLIAPCGLVCLLCHHHCMEPDAPCAGCRGGHGKSEHCRSCDILQCVESRHLRYCAECDAYPCARLKAFDAHYRADYGHAILPHSERLRTDGEAALLEQIRRTWVCQKDGGIICIHGDHCSECGKEEKR